MRRFGIGKHLFTLACGFAKQCGAKKLYLSAHSSEESQAFYHALGCREAHWYHPSLTAAEPCDCQLEKTFLTRQYQKNCPFFLTVIIRARKGSFLYSVYSAGGIGCSCATVGEGSFALLTNAERRSIASGTIFTIASAAVRFWLTFKMRTSPSRSTRKQSG